MSFAAAAASATPAAAATAGEQREHKKNKQNPPKDSRWESHGAVSNRTPMAGPCRSNEQRVIPLPANPSRKTGGGCRYLVETGGGAKAGKSVCVAKAVTP